MASAHLMGAKPKVKAWFKCPFPSAAVRVISGTQAVEPVRFDTP
jgi:hypothetical protein